MTPTNKQVTTRLKQLAGAALLALCAAGAEAAGYAGTQFEIEMVVFSRESGMNQSRETWPAAPQLAYDSRWIDFNTPSSADPMVPALQPAPNQLDNKVAALKRSSGYQVLFHKTWRQVLQNERNAPAVLVSGGAADGRHHQLEGSVTLSVSRYLHLSTDLWLSEWLPQTSSAFGYDAPTAGFPSDSIDATRPQGISVPTRPRAAVIATRDNAMAGDEPMDLRNTPAAPHDSGYSTTSGYSTGADSVEFHGDSTMNAPGIAEPVAKMAARVAVLNEERRLRSGELHYIDHPKLGVLIEVRTVQQAAEPAAQDEPADLAP
ncbi:CsiV family protein [uncultured Microbulbifer sp.]|uniref:CsiV family protein n=1 Tax=uncultured Microbulbifer sp. TaxID=348147 RepID=UPI0026144FBC|nr:CsiV family protein [uncultured Microbulbifer sp.]